MARHVVCSGEAPCALEKNVSPSDFGWNVVNISVTSSWSRVAFRAMVSLLVFCSDDLSTAVSGLLKSPTRMVFCPVSFFLFVSHRFLHLGLPP